MSGDATTHAARRLSVRFSQIADSEERAATETDAIAADLEYVEKLKFSIAEMKENAGADTSLAVQSFKEHKDLFGKLKFNFLELDAKDRFLRELQNDAPLLPQEEVTALEGAVAARKHALSQAKERYEADRTEVAQLIEATTADYDVYAAALADARDLLADVRRVEADLAATQDRPRALLSLTLQEARGVLDEQEAFLREIDSEMQVRAARVEAALATKAAHDLDVVRLRAEHTALQAELERLAYDDAHRDRSLETNVAWFTEMAVIVKTLSGLDARMVAPGQVEVTIARPAPAGPVRVLLTLETGSGRVTSCSVVDGPGVSIDDIAKRLCPSDHPAVLVAAIQQRVLAPVQ